MPGPDPRPSNEDRIKAALWFAERGFGVFPVWSTRGDGTCRCPAGQRCTSAGKHPITREGFRDATTETARIRAFLSAASGPNYGLVPPEGVFVWDVDSDEERERLARLGSSHGPLPATLRDTTAHGEHVFWRWPDGLPRPLRRMFGLVTRWGSGSQAGYVIGPRSVHASGAEYAPAPGTTFEIATLPDAWARAAVEGEGSTITIGGRADPATVRVGGRHDWLRDTARLYAGVVRDPDALFAAVWAANEKLSAPKTQDEVRRAIGDVLERFGPDPVEEDPETGVTTVVAPSAAPGMLTFTDTAVIPAPPPDVAFGGPLGACARHLAAGTDASPVALLGSLLSFCGSLMPVWGYWHGRHTSSPYIALVGKQADGRKGTAMHRVKEALARALGTETVNGLTLDSLASGEALVKAMLDRDRASRGVPTGVLFEEEYAALLAVASRDGSTLDARMRAAFDGKQMAHRRVGEVLVVREPYWLSGLIAITPRELQERARKDSSWNGTNNRWLWLAVERRDERVMSSEPDLPPELADILRETHDTHTRSSSQLRVSGEADDLLSAYGDHLRARTTGSAAPLTRRYPTIAFRIALVHAASEMVDAVGIEHVRRAIALCEYGRASLPFVFADTLGNAQATHLLRMLQQSEAGVLTLTDLGREFMRDPIKRQVVIDDLQELGLARVVRVRTNGRARTELHLVPQEGGFADFAALFRTPNPTPETEPSVDKRGKGAGKGRERVPEGTAKAPEDTWAKPCERYVDHRSDHRAYALGWVCLACWPPPVLGDGPCPDCGVGPFPSTEHYARHWHETHPAWRRT